MDSSFLSDNSTKRSDLILREENDDGVLSANELKQIDTFTTDFLDSQIPIGESNKSSSEDSNDDGLKDDISETFFDSDDDNTLPEHEETVGNQQLSPFNTISTGSSYFRYWEEEDVSSIVHDLSNTRTPLQQCIHSMNMKEKIVNRVIESYVSQILQHYRSSIIGGSAHLPYIEVFKTLSEPGIPHNVYNKVDDSIGQNLYSETRNQSERLH